MFLLLSESSLFVYGRSRVFYPLRRSEVSKETVRYISSQCLVPTNLLIVVIYLFNLEWLYMFVCDGCTRFFEISFNIYLKLLKAEKRRRKSRTSNVYSLLALFCSSPTPEGNIWFIPATYCVSLPLGFFKHFSLKTAVCCSLKWRTVTVKPKQ